MLIVFGLLFLVAVLFTTNRFRPDLIALCAAVLLVLTGTLSAQEALSAFGNTTVIMIAALFVIGAGINNTGITKFIGDRITESIKPGQEGKLTATITSVVGSLGAVMSSTGIVSLFIPVIQRIVYITGIDKKKIHLHTPIKALGNHSTKIKLHPEVSVELSFDIVSENPIEESAEEGEEAATEEKAEA